MYVPAPALHGQKLDEGDLIRDVVAGRLIVPETGQPLRSPIRSVRIDGDLSGGEADLIAAAGLTGQIAVVADDNTWAALGRRVQRALPRTTPPIVLKRPRADDATADDLADRLRHADAIVAVGAGTINDLVKTVAHRSGRAYAVFGTALSMNGYTTTTASLFDAAGMKTTRPARAPVGVFLDIGAVANAPLRLTRAGLGDSVCRTTAQVDWLLSHLLLGTSYSDTPFQLQAADEDRMLKLAGRLAWRDPEAYVALARILVLTGMGSFVTGTSHSGSMAEHMISHSIDMLAGPDHPGSLHGEQVGIATLAVARLQELVLDRAAPPTLAAQVISDETILTPFGAAGPACLAEFCKKEMDGPARRHLTDKLASEWPGIRAKLRPKLKRRTELEAALRAAGAPLTPEDIALPRKVWRDAVKLARLTRNRFTILDIAAESGLLDAELDRLP
ncbi:iron-containing alcohol dehydrogenase [Oryzibacter oryziterrae]|uniref:iron-containing alcohol dehydrogenase n=1 Tax=Oryzibacter oryziterrae TaxID=2766474 RepID=UPI001F3BFE3D|nr:iron-containing alcohol dehydrogenase [Oryzibacter oryziterrae]